MDKEDESVIDELNMLINHELEENSEPFVPAHVATIMAAAKLLEQFAEEIATLKAHNTDVEELNRNLTKAKQESDDHRWRLYEELQALRRAIYFYANYNEQIEDVFSNKAAKRLLGEMFIK